MAEQKTYTYQIKITGLVQGVGFRPFIYVLAEKFNLQGWVENRNDGVLIKANADKNKIKNFIEAIKQKAPIASSIENITLTEIDFEIFEAFSIKKSENKSDAVTEVSPDIAVCNDCLEDIKSQKHRKNYPFTNCTNCGPRFTIIKDLPYDRAKTTMNEFKMCEVCEKEYTDIYNRRFHAQPVACTTCGPHYTLHYKDDKTTNINEILNISTSLTEAGKIIAIKGLGGYHLMCDAKNEDAVTNLRNLKNRESKAFAVMFGNTEKLEKYVYISEQEKKEIRSWQRPILLLKSKKKLAFSVSNGLSNLGVMLPYMPFHHMLFEHLNTDAIVLTSGNFADEPIITSNKEALEKFSGKVDAIITYNRKIHNRTDDSVGMLVNDKLRLLRRSRGFAPSSIRTEFNTEGIFAAGAEFVNCFCIGKGDRAFMSQHIGDLKNLETYEFYKESYELYKRLFRFTPKYIVADLHPDYLSSKFAEELNEQDPETKLIRVQHHHAHIVSCMAEHQLDEKVLGISFDGVGLGDDGNIWGGEFLINDLSDYDRFSHFEYIPVSGGDSVSKEPWRSATSYLYHYFGEDIFNSLPFFTEKVGNGKINMYLQILKNNFNTYKTSSAGRLFDAVSSLLGLVNVAGYHAEAPMRLESIVDESVKESYDFEFNEVVSFKKTFKSIIDDLKKDINISIISAKFHNTVVNVVIKLSELMKQKTGINKVVLSGGTFQNKYLLTRVENELTNKNFEVYSPLKIPANDGGIALGQLVIGAKRIRL
ncbi:MAG: carbamoyltransferase HypF [Bacteroidales bacterium]|nr:carbamoyltransferase HypF [Bacteroidales bacterium]